MIDFRHDNKILCSTFDKDSPQTKLFVVRSKAEVCSTFTSSILFSINSHMTSVTYLAPFSSKML